MLPVDANCKSHIGPNDVVVRGAFAAARAAAESLVHHGLKRSPVSKNQPQRDHGVRRNSIVKVVFRSSVDGSDGSVSGACEALACSAMSWDNHHWPVVPTDSAVL